jgi:hypothetical protein
MVWLLRYLMPNAGRVVSKGQILDNVWGHNPAGQGSVAEPCVSVDTEPGHGAAFHVRLPLATGLELAPGEASTA